MGQNLFKDTAEKIGLKEKPITIALCDTVEQNNSQLRKRGG